MYRYFTHKVFFAYMPVFFILMQVGIEIFTPAEHISDLHAESGPHEAIQSLFLFLGILFSIKLMQLSPHKFLFVWGFISFIGCFYVFGEELSWGQHIFNWNTPDYWSALNDQQETNLHNTSSWLDQKPRILLEVGVIFCGLIFPFLTRFKPTVIPPFIKPVLADYRVVIIALCYLLTKLTSKISEALGDDILTRSSEVEELFLYMFVVVYLSVLCQRFALRQNTMEETDGFAT